LCSIYWSDVNRQTFSLLYDQNPKELFIRLPPTKLPASFASLAALLSPEARVLRKCLSVERAQHFLHSPAALRVQEARGQGLLPLPKTTALARVFFQAFAGHREFLDQ
jgi:hypothetical protein